MPRYALLIEYDGAPFFGWQTQPNVPSVQGAIEDALAKLNPTRPRIQTAGRTDAGVHATGQVAHVDLDRDWDTFKLRGAINAHMRPHPIAILDVVRVPDDFKARFSAKERSYRYRILARKAPPVLTKGRVWAIGYTLDIEAMQQGAQHLLGRHDYSTFRASECQAKSPEKSIDELTVSKWDANGGEEVIIDVRARSFLHNQVRSIVGSLVKVGSGTWHPDQIKVVLEAKDRTACGPVAPPHGLYLVHVRYDPDPFASDA